jgi:transposase
LKSLADKYGLTSKLENVFGKEAKDLFNMAAFQLCEGKPFYLMKSWIEGTHIDLMSIVDSQDISRFFDDLGRRDYDRRQFIEEWSRIWTKSSAVAFDITSLSSYGKPIDFLEKGYNRDGEMLPQVNLGIVMNIPEGIPLSYHIYPGSIPDVATLSNIVKELKWQGINIKRFVLDRGFYSTRNICEVFRKKIPFIIPMPFRSHLSMRLLLESRKALQSPLNAFVYQNLTMFHTSISVEIGGYSCIAHVYLNEERKARETNRLIHKLTELEEYISHQKYKTLEEALEDIQSRGQGLEKLFTVRIKNNRAILKRKPRKLSSLINRHGKLIIVTNEEELTREELISLYKQRDMIEKLFDIIKNEFDSRRIRIHSRQSLEGRLFVMFISMILYFFLQLHIRKNEFLNKFSVAEILATLRTLRSVTLSNNKSYLTEISKKHRQIFEAFSIKIPSYPCY